MKTRDRDLRLTIDGHEYMPLADAARLVGCETDPDLIEDLYATYPIALVVSAGKAVVRHRGRRWVPYDDLDVLRFWVSYWQSRPQRKHMRRGRTARRPHSR